MTEPVDGPRPDHPPDATASPANPAGAAGPAGPNARTKPRQPVLWGFLGLVVVAVVGSLVALSAVRAAAPSPEESAGTAVQGFLEAVAAGDAAKALSFAATPPADATLLTDEVLTASQKLAPIHDIRVTPTVGTTGAVDVAYGLGDAQVTDHYSATQVGGDYKLRTVTDSLALVLTDVHQLPVLVNGVPLDGSASMLELFPGRYDFTTGLANVDWGPKASATVQVSSQGTSPELAPRVTDAGKRAFLAGAKRLIGTCTGKHDLAPSGCPFGFRQPTSGPRVTQSTVRWTVKGNPWKALGDPEIESFTGPGLAKASTTMAFTCTCRFSNGDACRPQSTSNRVTFAGDVTTEPMKVVLTAF